MDSRPGSSKPNFMTYVPKTLAMDNQAYGMDNQAYGMNNQAYDMDNQVYDMDNQAYVMDNQAYDRTEEREDESHRGRKKESSNIQNEEQTKAHTKGKNNIAEQVKKMFGKSGKSGPDDYTIEVEGKSGNQSSSGGNSGGGTAGGGTAGGSGGAMSAVAVCGGSAVMASANSVVTLSLHQSIASLNEDFAAGNSTACIDGMTNVVDEGYLGNGAFAQQTRACLNVAYDIDAWNCLAGLLYDMGYSLRYEIGRSLSPLFNACLNKGTDFYPCVYKNIPDMNEMKVYRGIADYCSYLWSPESSNITLPAWYNPPSFRRLTAEIDASTTGSTEDGEFGNLLNYMFLAVSLFFVLFGAVLSVFTGYRITSVIGSLLVAIGFIVASFIDESNEVVVQILVGGVGGIGSAFLKVASLIAVLEYFKGMRMRAIVISGMGAVLINFLMIGLGMAPSIDFDWRTSFRLQAIPAAFSLISGIIMMIKGRDRDEEDVEWQKKFSKYVFSRHLFTNRVLYLVMCLYLLDQAGRPIFSDGMQPYLEDRQFDKTQTDIQPFIEKGGSLLGLLMLLLWKRQNMADNLFVMGALDILVGFMALHVPVLRVYAWAVTYSAIYGFSDGVFGSMIQDSIPKGFRKKDIKMVAGLFGLVAGIGTIMSGLVKDAIDNSDGEHDSFYFAGACLIGAGILCFVTRAVYEKQ